MICIVVAVFILMASANLIIEINKSGKVAPVVVPILSIVMITPSRSSAFFVTQHGQVRFSELGYIIVTLFDRFSIDTSPYKTKNYLWLDKLRPYENIAMNELHKVFFTVHKSRNKKPLILVFTLNAKKNENQDLITFAPQPAVQHCVPLGRVWSLLGKHAVAVLAFISTGSSNF